MTDGIIHDMSAVKKLIVESSGMPTSIIIVGIGNEDFEMMEDLDCDNKLLVDDDNIKAKRDIVQFVKFNDAIKKGDLAEQVLKEIPSQLCQYMANKEIEFDPTNQNRAKYDEQEVVIEDMKEGMKKLLNRI